MKRLWTLAAIAFIAAACTTGSPRSTEDFNFGWKFQLGDAAGMAAPDFDDSAWRNLHLPHDWSVEGEFSADNPSTPGGGALPGGIGWYRKHFTTPEGAVKVYVEFDGVFMNSTVYVNGTSAGTRPYGYSSFSYDITDLLNPAGRDNVIAVRCDNSDQPNSRWYAGCGIYRNVRLVTTEEAHIAYNGLYVSPRVEDGKAIVHIEAEAEGMQEGQRITFRIDDAAGRKVGFAEASGSGPYVADIEIASPHLWDIDDTYMYSVTAYVTGGRRICDSYSRNFGVRTCEWDADKGFFLNGRNVKLLGVCLHHDMGCLGTAVHRRALERELGILKDMGCNAIRTSHNPPTPELLELCDNMGFLVLDEAFDMWRKKKTQFDYARFFDEWHEKDLRDFIRRDRNHPCIFMWSIGNEILEQWNSDEDNVENLSAEEANLLMNFMSSLPQYEAGDDNPNIVLAKHLAAIVKEMDPTRPVTSGCNETQPFNNLLRSGALDVYGFNYHTWDYDKMRDWYPGIPMFGSETASSLNSRGFYPQPSTDIQRQPARWDLPYDTEHHQCTSYDALCAPWADLHEHAWVEIRDREWMGGTFVWTGFDYLGEPTPYSWPARSSYFGIVDLAGFPKDCYYMYQSEWRPDLTVMHLFPHWNWKEGDKVDMWCYYNNADEVELFLNGKSLGRSHKEGEQLRAQWLGVDWEPGTVEAVSYKDGAEVARDSRTTTGAPVALKATPDRTEISADGYDLSYVTITAVDENGREVPTATNLLKFKVEGEGELVGVDNGNPIDHMSLKGDTKALFAGKALAVVRSLPGQKGTATLSVSAEGLGNITQNITVK